ncbi:MAG: DUF3604 domain-containing protein [Myxococcota bacterium]
MHRPARDWTVGLLLLALGCGESIDPAEYQVQESPEIEPVACDHRDPGRRAFFGDLHVHTALSSDATGYGVRVRPTEAYGYAFGDPILLPPNDDDGKGTREVRIDRPLDFAALTDHAEFLGEQRLCQDPESEVYDREFCVAIRTSTTPIDNPLAIQIMHPFPSRDEEVCGPEGVRCKTAVSEAWRETIAAAEEWNDTTAACRRTTFIGYEYSSFRLGSNLHRNVIFATRQVPSRPISYLEATREWELWELLRDVCVEPENGCDVLAIPHNSNISNGRMFSVDYPGAGSVAAQAERARLRARIEPIVEVMQHKGDSECRVSIDGVLGAEDELCAFEKFEDLAFQRLGDELPGTCWDGTIGDSIPRLGPSCLSPRSYVRYALTQGVAEEARIGVNPFRFGLTASTDTHNGMAGGVEERSYPGHLGTADGVLDGRLAAEPGRMGNASNGPGGLIGVWAEENSRPALFAAMQRREVFGTSGPRIRPRFYAGWDYTDDLCDAADRLDQAEAGGIPMGGVLSPSRTGEPPTFAVWATRDLGTARAPGGLLQRIQIIKGWVDDDGELHQRVIDVAGGPNRADVDPETCQPRGKGARTLCGVWRDADFDPDRGAVYYARVLENPSCRYTTWQCLDLPEDERPSACDDAVLAAPQQERAWTSPIWYPDPGAKG